LDAGKRGGAGAHAGQVQPRFGCVDHAWQAGEGQVAAQDAMRPGPGEGGNKFAGAGHPLTVAHRGAAPDILQRRAP
jgi:hypothetical protein